MKTKLIILVMLVVCFSCGYQSKKVSSSGIINVNGVELSYVTEGTGQPCLFYAIPQYSQKSFSNNFKSQFQCTFVDSKFNNITAVADTLSPFTIDAAVEEIEAIRKALNMPKFILIGHSILGIIVLDYAKQYPQNISHVIAIGTMPEISKDQNKLAADYWNNDASAERKEIYSNNLKIIKKDSLAKLSPSNRFIASIIRQAPRRWYDSTYNESHLLVGQNYNMPILNQLSAQDFFLFSDSVKIKPPVFLAMGKYDFACPYPAWEKYLGMFDDITFQLFNYSGHNPHTEEAAKFDSLVIDWIEKK
ncbi:alpha/beta hydrolase [Candidatus Dojkabacteria bacterium]|nr:alpha/beta hydrolase [Candidatus Dojkabacteria bacterium]